MKRVRLSALLCCMMAWTCAAFAQQSVDYASVSGRVTDPSGAVVPGAQVTARQTRHQRRRRRPSTDQEGRFRFPYLQSRPVRDHRPARRLRGRDRGALTLTVGAAFELPITLAVGGVDTNVTVTGDGDGARGGAQPDCRHRLARPKSGALPMNGRNFLDLALLVPGVSPTNVAQHAAVSRDVGGAGRQPLGRQPAQPLEQLHRRRPVGQRRCGGAERHHVRRRCGRAVPGRDVRRAGGARPRARRLRQRRDQERHERCCTAPRTTTSATIASTRRMRCRARRCR